LTVVDSTPKRMFLDLGR